MFGLKSKRQKTIEELEARLVNNSKIIEEDHHDLKELTVLVQLLQTANTELVAKVAELESRQHNLRDGLGKLTTPDKPSTTDFSIDDPALD